jgi:hypothetical protein
VNRYVPRFEELEPRTVPSTNVTSVIELPSLPSATKVFAELLATNPSWRAQLASASTSSMVLAAQPTQQTLVLGSISPGALAVNVAVPAGPLASFANNITVSFNGCSIATIPGSGTSLDPAEVRIELPASNAQQSTYCSSMAADAASAPGVAVALSQSTNSWMSALTLTIASVRVNTGQVGILLVVASGSSLDAQLIWLIAPSSEAPASPPDKTGSFSGLAFLPGPEPNALPRPGAPHEQLAGGPLAFEVAARAFAPFQAVLVMTDLQRRASTPSAYITWSGRDDPALSLKPTSTATSATSHDDASSEKTIAPVHGASSLFGLPAKTDSHVFPLKQQALAAEAGIGIGAAWAAEANVARQILPEDEPLDTPSSPRRAVQSARSRATVRGIALMAISVTATWLFGHGYGDLINTRLVLPRRERAQT